MDAIAAAHENLSTTIVQTDIDLVLSQELMTTNSNSSASSSRQPPSDVLAQMRLMAPPPSAIVILFANWEETILQEFKDEFSSFLKKKFYVDCLKKHKADRTFPSDFRIKFSPCKNLPHSISEADREAHAEYEADSFRLWQDQIMDRRLNILEMDLINCRAQCANLKKDDFLKDRLLAASPSLNQFMHVFPGHLVSYLARTELYESEKKVDAEKKAAALSAAKAKAAAIAAAAASSSTAMDVDIDLSDMPASTEKSVLSTLIAEVTRLTSEVSKITLAAAKGRSEQHPAPVAASAPGPSAPRKNPPPASKSLKNSHGSGGKPTSQAPKHDDRGRRPPPRQQQHRRDRDRGHHSRSRSRPPSRSGHSQSKRRHSPSPDRDDDRSRSRPRVHRSRTPSPHSHHRRGDRDDGDRGRSPPPRRENRARSDRI